MDDYVFINNELSEHLRFDPAQSYMISYGIDYQSFPRFAPKTLTSIAVSDANEVLHSFVSSGVIPAANARLLAASRKTDECTFDGMHQSFCKQARKAGKEGVFVFHFSGHGIKLRDEEWGLAPVDFDFTWDTYITARVLNGWLLEAGCEATKIFIFDSCYSGGLGKELTAFSYVSGLYVICACTANEASISMGSLGHSIFSYFLSKSIVSNVKQDGLFPIKKVYSDCKSCSVALSSLLVVFDSSTGHVRAGTMQPVIAHFDLRSIVLQATGSSSDQVDAAVGRFDGIVRLYDYGRPIHALHDKCVAWLNTKCDSGGPLEMLSKRKLLVGKVMDTVICSMMYSIASIQFCYEPQVLCQEPNLFVSALIHCAAAIDFILKDIELSPRQVLYALAFYKSVLEENNSVDGRVFQDLISKVEANVSHGWTEPGADEVDGGEVQREVSVGFICSYKVSLCSMHRFLSRPLRKESLRLGE